jgi:hypothetical protein
MLIEIRLRELITSTIGKNWRISENIPESNLVANFVNGVHAIFSVPVSKEEILASRSWIWDFAIAPLLYCASINHNYSESAISTAYKVCTIFEGELQMQHQITEYRNAIAQIAEGESWSLLSGNFTLAIHKAWEMDK